MFSYRRSARLRSSSYVLVYLYMTVVHTYAAFTIDPSCTNANGVNDAVTEAQQIAQNAHDLTLSSLNGQLTDADEELRITLNYSPWFGDALSNDAQGNNQANGQVDRATSVINALNAVQASIQAGSPSMNIRCDDPPITQQQGVRVATQNGQSFALTANFVTCADNSNQIAYAIPAQSLIVLCPPAFTNPTTLGGPVTAFKVGQSLDTLRTLSTILLHEFMHIFGGPNILGDQSGGANPTGEQYGYQACTTMRQNHVDLTPTNPDSLTLYAVALALSQNNWASGLAAPLARAAPP